MKLYAFTESPKICNDVLQTSAWLLNQPMEILQVCKNGAEISRENDSLLTFLFLSLA